MLVVATLLWNDVQAQTNAPAAAVTTATSAPVTAAAAASSSTSAPTAQPWGGCINQKDPSTVVKIGAPTIVCLQIGNNTNWADGVSYIRLSFTPTADEYSRYYVPNCTFVRQLHLSLFSSQQNDDPFFEGRVPYGPEAFLFLTR